MFFIAPRTWAAAVAAVALVVSSFSLKPGTETEPTADGRIGKVTDCQGLVSVKPVAHARWTPITEHTVLKPRDWIRTDLRGAHAAALRLGTSIRVTLGPGTLAELGSPQRVKLISGELKVVADPEQPLTLIGPDGAATTVQGTGIYRVDQDKLVTLNVAPGWIAGFEGTSTQEAIGSLVARIDGRDVPLTVGFHTVTVDIRDQIARTVIDESFVNHTADQLEGVFYFPLPADASISGFGMWIGDEYVEADIVEKQRAREIYETILREKRDPGLLEWTGGNMFKARVFPILGNSEKRIRISYTQVLSRTGNRYRYSYALQSELLRQHPLRALGIDVKISSAVPITAVTSPTHATRIDKTDKSARVEFTAQEYTPTRDFEVVVELGQGKPLTPTPLPLGRGEGTASADQGLVLIPHQRGEDGYFMLQVQPPTATTAASAAREVLPDGQPLKLVLLADTSRSMDAASRQAQSEFIAALTSSLSPQDQFNLGTCDVDCQWAFDNLVPAEEGNVQSARKMLDERVSLGWTDLDKAFAAALQQAGSDGQVIYIGDGIVTTGDADPVEFTKRLQRLYEGHQAKLHAVATSSRYEAAVLKSIATLGDGSLHRITGELGPVAVARQLLAELTQPSTRILKVEFPGLLTARVFPQDFPRLPEGAQQIILGRYLPQAGQTDCEAVVTAERGGKTFELRGPVSLQAAGGDESFIPRLWARMHLDALLEQGSSQAVQDEIIALSEEYHIITPYTSLLVLETDADRERFKVQRRFLMRDAERFFAEGRAQVDYNLLQQQMRQAGDWRIQLRTAVLRGLSTLGREADLERLRQLESRRRYSVFGMGGMGGMGGWAPTEVHERVLDLIANSISVDSWYPSFHGSSRFDPSFAARNKYYAADLLPASLQAYGGTLHSGSADNYRYNVLADARSSDTGLGSDDVLLTDVYPVTDLVIPQAALAKSVGFGVGGAGTMADFDTQLSLIISQTQKVASSWSASEGVYDTTRSSRPTALGTRSFRGSAGANREGPDWTRSLFPDLSPAAPTPLPADHKSTWPAEAVAISESLLRTRELAAIRPGLEIVCDDRWFDPRWDDPPTHTQMSALVSPTDWLVRWSDDNDETLVETCDQQHREIYSRALLLGRSRAATECDLRKPPLILEGYLLTPLESTRSDDVVEVERQSDTITVLRITDPDDDGSHERYVIDTQRKVLLSHEVKAGDDVRFVTTLSDFVELAGAWWPTRVETRDARGRRVELVTQQFRLLDDAQFAARQAEELRGRDDVQFLRQPPVTMRAAKHAIGKGQGTFDDHFAMLTHFYAIQKWDRVLQHLESMETLAGGKPGLRWVRDAVLVDARGGEEARERMMQRAAELAQLPADQINLDVIALAEYLLQLASDVLEANEYLALVNSLRPVFDARAPKGRWQGWQIGALADAGQAEKALELSRQLAVDFPHDADLQRDYAESLVEAKEYAAAKAWLDRVLVPAAQWDAYEEESLREVITDMYREQDRYDNLADYLTAWVATEPEDDAAGAEYAEDGVYAQYLSALIKTDRIEQATQLADQWLADGLRPGRLPHPVAARLTAAAELALGDGFELDTGRPDPRWAQPLANTVLFFAQQDPLPDCIDEIMSDSGFQETEQFQRVQSEIVRLLSDKVATLPVRHVRRFVHWFQSCDVDSSVWVAVATGLRERWKGEIRPDRKHDLGEVLTSVLEAQCSRDEHVQFLRLQLEQGPERYRARYADRLFEALLDGPWSIAREDEVFALLPRLSDAGDPSERLAVQVSKLQQLTDSMVQARFSALMEQVANQSQLTRTELRDNRLENMKQARTQYAQRLKDRIRTAPESLAPWITAEWMHVQVMLGENLPEVEEGCWEALGAAPPTIDTGNPTGDELQRILQGRFLAALMNLATRHDARPELIDRLIAYIDQGIAAGDETSDVWRLHKFRLLVALDRSDELATVLREWIEADDAVTDVWRLSLGYLLAEQGQLSEAIECFEKLRSSDLLTADELKLLADWYLALNEREKYQQARIAAFEQTNDWELKNTLEQELARWATPTTDVDTSDSNPFGDAQDTFADAADPFAGYSQPIPVPDELGDEVPQIFVALFAKTSEPDEYVDLLRKFYVATRDFRLLAGLADAVIGQTAGRIYPLLKTADRVISEVRDEATVDALVAHIADVRKQAKSAVDQRALDLLEMVCERRAVELLDQPGPHASRALAAMQRAFQRDWSEGEPRLMADCLAGLREIPDAALAQEQVRHLEVLYRQAEVGTIDRLEIAHNLFKVYGKSDRKADVLQAALEELERARGGALPALANDALTTYVMDFAQRGQYVRAERVLREQLKHPANAQQSLWLTEKLHELYTHALAHDGETSLGKGPALYEALVNRLQGELRHDDKQHRTASIGQLLAVYAEANGAQIKSAPQDCVAFARDQLPLVLKEQVSDYHDIVTSTAASIETLAGVREAMVYVIQAINGEPRWMAYTSEDGWSVHAEQLAIWRIVCNDLGDLEEPLLTLVTSQLRRDLETRQQRSREFCSQEEGSFWETQRDTFLRTAETVYARHQDSPEAVKYIAEYVAGGLGAYDRGIEMLLPCLRDGTLDEDDQVTLVRWFQHEDRFDESVPLLQEMVKRWPDNLTYCVLLMHAYCQSQRSTELLALLEHTDAHFHEHRQWDESTIAQLSAACVDCRLFEQAVKYYGELIPLHKRRQPDLRMGEGTLSAYCSRLAQAYAGLGKTAEAVDAACEAIVSWGPRHEQRQETLELLTRILREAQDLEQFVERLDREAQETGRDKPVVRKALGTVYADRQQWAPAIAQLKLAFQLQPDDLETSTRLVDCYDAQGDPQAAIDQLLASLEINPRDMEVCKDLARQYRKMGRTADVERAYTSIVELLPHEAEGHAELATIREDQDRWQDAALHWHQVAHIRRLEPTGWLGLAHAQIHLQQWDAARETIAKLRSQTWPERFGNVQGQVDDLEGTIRRQATGDRR